MPQSSAKTKKKRAMWGWRVVTHFTEHDLQIHIATLIHAWALSRPYVFWTGIDHAAKVSIKYGKDRKMRGIKAGIPDFHITYKGKPVWLEAKSERGRVQPSQNKMHEQIKAAGGYVFVVRKLDDVWTVLNWMETEDWDNPPVFVRKEIPPQLHEGRDRYLAKRRAEKAARMAAAAGSTTGWSGEGQAQG